MSLNKWFMACLVVLSSVACFPVKDGEQTAAAPEISDDSHMGDGLQPEEVSLLSADIEEMSLVHEENEFLDPEAKSPNVDPHRAELWDILRRLLEGPCSEASVKALSAISANIDHRLELLEKLLAEAQDDAVIEALKKRIARLENLKAKVEEKIAECKSGISDCSDKFVANLKLQLGLLQHRADELKEKLSNVQDPAAHELLEQALKRLEQEIARLSELLKKCS